MGRKSKQEDQYPKKKALKKCVLLTPVVTAKYYAKHRLSGSLFKVKLITATSPEGSKQQLYKWHRCQGNASEQVDSGSPGAPWERIISRGRCRLLASSCRKGKRLLLCSLLSCFHPSVPFDSVSCSYFLPGISWDCV